MIMLKRGRLAIGNWVTSFERPTDFQIKVHMSSLNVDCERFNNVH